MRFYQRIKNIGLICLKTLHGVRLWIILYMMATRCEFDRSNAKCSRCAGIIGNLIVSLGYKIVVLRTIVRHKNSFGYVKK